MSTFINPKGRNDKTTKMDGEMIKNIFKTQCNNNNTQLTYKNTYYTLKYIDLVMH